MTARVVAAPGASSRERAYLQALVEHADPLGLGGVAPELEERRGLELRELAGGALAGLLRRLAGLRRRLSGAPRGNQLAAECQKLVDDYISTKYAVKRT